MSIKQIVDEHVNIKIGDDAETLPDQTKHIGYSCPVCGKVYDIYEDAYDCRNQPYDTGDLKVGDIVVVPGAYHNVYVREGEPWTAFILPGDPNSKDPFDRRDHNIPYFVVTALHDDPSDPHCCLVTLCRPFIGNGGKRYLRAGWNPANGDGHYAMFRVSDGKRNDVGSFWYEYIQDYLDKCEPCETLLKEAAELASIGISSRNLL